MEVTFNTGLDDISKRIIERRNTESETVWEAQLRKQREKRKAKKSNKVSADGSDDNGEGTDGFSSGGPLLKKHKGEAKTEGARKGTNSSEVGQEAGASRAELELLLTDDKGIDSNVKGYKIKPEKTEGKKWKEVMDDQKLPEADLDDPRFQSLFKNPLFSLDPTDPQFKRSVAYRRQLVEKQKKAEQDAHSAENQIKSSDHAQRLFEDNDKISKPTSPSYGKAYEISTLVKSIKMNSKEVDKRGKNDMKSVAQSLKKKTKHLTK